MWQGHMTIEFATCKRRWSEIQILYETTLLCYSKKQDSCQIPDAEAILGGEDLQNKSLYGGSAQKYYAQFQIALAIIPRKLQGIIAKSDFAFIVDR